MYANIEIKMNLGTISASLVRDWFKVWNRHGMSCNKNLKYENICAPFILSMPNVSVLMHILANVYLQKYIFRFENFSFYCQKQRHKIRWE